MLEDNVAGAQAIDGFTPLTMFNDHTGSTDIHFTQSSISITESQVSDLGDYTLNTDFNTHTGNDSAHHTKYTDAEAQAAVSGLYADKTHTHVETDITDLQSYALQTTLDTHTDDTTIHFTQSAISITESQVRDLDKYTQAEVDALITGIESNDIDISGTPASGQYTRWTDDHTIEGVVDIKSDLGLDNVDNTSDLDKPISTATQTALDGKSDTGHSHTESDITDLQTYALQSSLDTHTNDTTIHYTQSSISITESQISDLDKYTQSEVDSLIDDTVQRSEWDQNGIVDKSVALTFTDSTRTLTIPATDYYVGGVKYTSTGDTFVISTTEGIHVVYYGTGGTLAEAVNPSDSDVKTVILNYAIVSIIYWDATNSTAIFVAEERHGLSMSPTTHWYLHFHNGMIYFWGLGLNTMTVDGDGSLDAHAQFGIDAGGGSDEDLYTGPAAVTSTTGLPIFYMVGSDWRRKDNAGFSVFINSGDTRICYNEYTGGSWQLTEVTDAYFVLCHVFLTNEKDTPMIAILGQNIYSTKRNAQAGAKNEIHELILNQLLFPEIRPIATVIFQTKSVYTNSIKARIVTTDDGDDYIDWRNEVVSRVALTTSEHGNLSGLAEDDHTQYLLVDGTRAMTGGLDLGSQTLSNPLDPTAGTHVGDRDYNDARYRLQSTVIDHGALSGLSDDDHTQYLLINGTRAMSGQLSVNGKMKITSLGKQIITNSTVGTRDLTEYRNVYMESNDNYTETGILKITLPTNWSGNMTTFRIRGFNYDYGPWEVVVGWYEYAAGSAYYSRNAYVNGEPPFNSIRAGNDGTHNFILLGDTTTVWKYKQICIDVLNGFNSFDFTQAFSTSILTTTPSSLTDMVVWHTSGFITSGWVNYGSGYDTFGYRKEGRTVFVKGMIQASGTLTTYVATLPVGFRPTLQKIFIVPYYGNYTRLDVKTNGVIAKNGLPTSGAWLSVEFSFIAGDE